MSCWPTSPGPSPRLTPRVVRGTDSTATMAVSAATKMNHNLAACRAALIRRPAEARRPGVSSIRSGWGEQAAHQLADRLAVGPALDLGHQRLHHASQVAGPRCACFADGLLRQSLQLLGGEALCQSASAPGGPP